MYIRIKMYDKYEVYLSQPNFLGNYVAPNIDLVLIFNKPSST